MLFKPYHSQRIYSVLLTEPSLGLFTTAQHANVLTLGYGKGKFSVYFRAPSKEKRAAYVQKTLTCQWFSIKVFFFFILIFFFFLAVLGLSCHMWDPCCIMQDHLQCVDSWCGV